MRAVTDLPFRIREIENAWVPLPGTDERMAARIFLPEVAGPHHPVPVILEYLPYRKRDFTSLHMFVVTLRCEHSCHYCQVSRQNTSHSGFDMSARTAELALDIVFRSPSPQLKIEFQGRVD